MKFRYEGYRSPLRSTGGMQTIVKVLPVASDQPPVTPAFARFDDDGFVVRLTDMRGVALSQSLLDATSLMVEVSEFGKLVLR